MKRGEGSDEERPQSAGLSGTAPAAEQPRARLARDRKQSERKEKRSGSPAAVSASACSPMLTRFSAAGIYREREKKKKKIDKGRETGRIYGGRSS